MSFINYNGKLLASSTPIVGSENRALRYGDGLFETIKLWKGELILADEHFARLWKGMDMMEFTIPKLMSPEQLTNEILKTAERNRHNSARVRLSLFRGNGGLFDTNNLSPSYLVETYPLHSSAGALNENGLTLCIYKDAIKTVDKFSSLKHNNFLPYLMGAIYAKRQQCNDAVILNNYGRICETTIANIFLIKDQDIFTPALSEGCIAGVMRKSIIQSDFHVKETEVNITMLMEADEIFITNSILDIRWVGSIENKTYTNVKTLEIFNELLKTNT